MSDVPNQHHERLIAGWGVRQVQSKDERAEKACECEVKKKKKSEKDGERKVLVKAT